MRSKILQEVLDETPKEVGIFVSWYADLVLRINQILAEKGYSQKYLADKLEKSPSEINKWLGGDHNFTLRSLAKLQAELGEVLLEVPKKQIVGEFNQTSTTKIYAVTVYRNNEAKATKYEDWKIVNPQPENQNVG